MPASEFLDLPPRAGLTHVLDKGYGLTAWRELLDAAGDYVDIVKLGWGTSYVLQNLDAKLEPLDELLEGKGLAAMLSPPRFFLIHPRAFPVFARRSRARGGRCGRISRGGVGRGHHRASHRASNFR